MGDIASYSTRAQIKVSGQSNFKSSRAPRWRKRSSLQNLGINKQFLGRIFNKKLEFTESYNHDTV